MDADKARFRQGFPEKIGGWVQSTVDTFIGVCRSIFTWVTLTDTILTGIGTSKKYYVDDSGMLEDITPIRDTNSLGADPLTSFAAGSGVITVTDTGHGASVGDFVTFTGATAFDGLTSGDLNQEHEVTQVIDVNSYRVDTGGSATLGSVAGGGAGITAAYQLSVGADQPVLGSGWGSSFWGREEWGSPALTSTVSGSLRRWTQVNWGEDLLFAPRYGEIYRYDASSGGRGVAIDTEGGASDVPVIVSEILLASRERILMALGTNEIGGSDQDEMLIRWTDFEDYLNWTPDVDNSAGGIRLAQGSGIVTGLETQSEILVWTDVALYALQFVGGEDVFSVRLLSPNTSIAGPGAKVSYLGATFWMGARGFFAFDGRISRLPCPVEDFVFNDISTDNFAKTVCGSNDRFNEVWWIYPSDGESEPNRYVAMNVSDGTWTVGTLGRTAWSDRAVGREYPRAASTDGYIYTHEFGLDDGSTNPPSAILSYVESAPVEIGPNDEIGRGDRISFVNRLIPDITFRNSTAVAPTLTYVFRQRKYPGNAYGDEDTSVAMVTVVDQYTGKKSIRLRARAIAMRVENEEVGVDWRLGSQRFETRTDGRK